MQVVIGVGLLAAVSYAVRQYVAPKVSQWYHEWRHDADKAKAEEEQQKTAQLVANAIQSQVPLTHSSEEYNAICTDWNWSTHICHPAPSAFIVSQALGLKTLSATQGHIVWQWGSEHTQTWRSYRQETLGDASVYASLSVHAGLTGGESCLQTAEMQKTLESLKDALTSLEKGKVPAEGPRDSITLTDLRSELRVLASSLNECAPAFGSDICPGAS